MPSMLVVGQQLALVAAAIFTGAAIHINVAEQPARLQLDPGPPTCTMEAQLRARIDLAILARDRVGCARCDGLFWQLGLALAAWSGADPRQLALHARGSSGQQAAGGDAAANVETRDLVETWGKLHAVRSALGLGATLVYLWATLQA
jgi:hypothetical protein